MSRNRNRNGKANNSNLVGRVAVAVIKEGDESKLQRMIIQNVNNGIAELVPLLDPNANPSYLPIQKLVIYNEARSQIYLKYSLKNNMCDMLESISGTAADNKNTESEKAKDKKPAPKTEQEGLTDDSEKNYLNHVLEGGVLMIKCSQFCRNYKVSPIYFVSKLSEHLYSLYERHAPKDNK